MPTLGTIVRVLIASPSDCAEERDVVTDVIYEWNAANTLSTPIIIEPIRWETHAIPELGDRPQALINRRLVDVSDILVGVFWTRLGTDTGVAASGTVEEIEQFQESGRPVMLYFSTAPVKLESIDLDQYTKLKTFRDSIKNQGLIFEFNSNEQLQVQFTRHLATVMKNLAEANAAVQIVKLSSPSQTSVVGNLLALSYRLVDIYVKYSSSPPTATLEQYITAEEALKAYLFDNRLLATSDEVTSFEWIITKIRTNINTGNSLAGILGGDGRPSTEQLFDYQNELMDKLKELESATRTKDA